jgi:signal transduction histidine kinase
MAGRVRQELTVSDEVTLKVSDDGTGMPPGTTRRSGLANLAQRAESLGGDFEIQSEPGRGTRVTWRVPL